MLGLGRLRRVGCSGSTQWNNPTNLTDPTGFVAGEGNTSTQLPIPDPEQVIIIGKKPSKTDPFAWMFPMFEGLGNKVPNESGLKKGSDNTGGQGNLGVMTTVNDKKLLSQKPCTSPTVKCDKQNKEREEAYERWLVGASGAVESICIECHLAVAAGLIKAGYVSVRGLFVADEALAVPEAYLGVKEASKYLKEMGMSRARRVEILQSFEVGTINVRTAGASEYGLRFYDGVKAFDKGRYLFETFPATREALALSSNWNQMTNVIQWQIKSGSVLFEGRAAAQGVGLSGGQIQKFVPSIESLVKVKP